LSGRLFANKEEQMPEEKFTRVIAMDFDLVDPAQTTWEKDLEDMEYKLATANATIHSNLKVTWQGNAAVEFYVAYDPIYQNLMAQIQRLKEMAKIFREEINDFGYMEEKLYPPTTVF
jgi:uncharacterized protein YukE